MDSFSVRREAGAGDAGTSGGSPPHADGNRNRSPARRAIALAQELAARIWRKEPRPVWVGYAVTALMAFAILLLCVYIGFAAVLYVTQRSLMYFPETIHTTPAQAGLPRPKRSRSPRPTACTSIAWHVPPRDGKPVILYFHGNGGALALSRRALQPAYRRRHRSRGARISRLWRFERQSERARPHRRRRGRLRLRRRALRGASRSCSWGESLGSGVAVALAAEKPVGRVILEAPFTSAAAVAARALLVSAGPALDEGSVPLRRAHRQSHRAGADPARRAATTPFPMPWASGCSISTNEPKHIVRFLDGGHEDLDKHGALHRRRPFPRRRFGSRKTRSSLRHGHQLEHVAVRIAEIDAAAAVPIVELAVVEAPRRAAESDLRSLDAAEDGVELAGC